MQPDQPRCASCGHERIEHFAGVSNPMCWRNDCSCAGWQEPPSANEVPTSADVAVRTPEAALAKAWDRQVRRTDMAFVDPEASVQVIEELGRLGWSLVRTPTDGDLTGDEAERRYESLMRILPDSFFPEGFWPLVRELQAIEQAAIKRDHDRG
ncbi:MAG: hypothetical protein KF809_17205 [Chloroflexi bacterium]|nr:hypothetical protein [Chloroflexota bacterium]